MSYSARETRRKSHAVMVGQVQVGGGAPIVVQSMTNTDTAATSPKMNDGDGPTKAHTTKVQIAKPITAGTK